MKMQIRVADVYGDLQTKDFLPIWVTRSEVDSIAK